MPEQIPADPYAATSWGAEPYLDFKTPSGQLCLLRRLQPADLLGSSLLGQVDGIGSLIREKIDKANPTPGAHAKPDKTEITDEEGIDFLLALMKGDQQGQQFSSVIDNITQIAVVKPNIHSVPDDPNDRVKGRVYIDSVPFVDKLEIFKKVMEEMRVTRQFPGVVDGDLEVVEAVASVPDAAESNSPD